MDCLFCFKVDGLGLAAQVALGKQSCVGFT